MSAVANAHLIASEARHRAADRAVAEEARRPLPDQLRLQALKKRRLYLKQKLTLLRIAAERNALTA